MKKVASLNLTSTYLALSLIFLFSSFISVSAQSKDFYVYDNEQDLAELDTEDELSSVEASDSTKEKILLDMLTSFITNLEAQIISVKQCAALAKVKTCADQNSFCDSVMGLTTSTGKTINMIQAYIQQKPLVRGLASASNDNASDLRFSEFKFSPGENSNYQKLRSKARRLKLEANQYCLANK
jgi:hypothetical protein